jgi:hypothetical protein
MKSWIRSMMAAGVAALSLSLLTPAHAEGEPQNVKEGKPKKRQFTGEIVSVDAAAKTFTLRNLKNEEKTFTCAETCRMTTGDKEVATLSDLKVGDRYTSIYMEEGDKNICHKLAPPKSKKKEKKE